MFIVACADIQGDSPQCPNIHSLVIYIRPKPEHDLHSFLIPKDVSAERTTTFLCLLNGQSDARGI